MILSSLTPQQYFDLLKHIDTFHRFGRDTKGKMMIKYVENSYDSRTRGIWMVTLKGFGDITFRVNAFAGVDENEIMKKFPYRTLYDWIMAFLNDEWEPDEYFRNFML